MKLMYFFSKIFKKLHGRAILRSQIHRTSKVEAGSELVNCSMGKHSFCGYFCEIANCDIGAFCSIANSVVIGGSQHPMEWVSMSPVFYEGRDSVKMKFSTHQREMSKRTIIGSDVWVGSRAIIKQGVKIGVGAVIGMGSVVTRDVEPYAIVGGNPAKLIRKRFSDDEIKKLLDSKWWEFPDEKLKKLGYLFNRPKDFLRELGL